MESKQSPSKKKLLSIKEEKLLREVDYDSYIKSSHTSKKPLFLDLEIQPKSPYSRQPSQRVLVSIKPRAPAIKTIYIAEKSRFYSKKGSEKSGSRLGIGDHSSFTTHYTDYDLNLNPVTRAPWRPAAPLKSDIGISIDTSTTDQVESSTSVAKCSQAEITSQRVYNGRQRSAECYIYTQPQLTMNIPRKDAKPENTKTKTNKVDIATLIYTNTSTEDTAFPSSITINKLNKRIDYLERKILQQEIMFRSMNPNLTLSSSDEESKDNIMKSSSGTARPGCSYIEQYSHIPETSAFQKYTQPPAPLSPSKATTLDKEHNSEQYGRDFTTYDGITARGRRQCASVPCKRDDIPKMAAERVHKIRHKLNPVRDYRLMDTVHYLAQGEFAPRDDGIKLTPSREAVLSDIIWEDVCRTHWPNARLGRRVATHPERYSTRCELQRLIDNLLRERVAHVERRRRRHYRIVKLNHRHESCRPVGKTGDIIVASHKNKDGNEEKDVTISDHNAASAMIADRKWEERNTRKTPRSHDRFMFPETRHSRRVRPDDCVPGTSYATPRSPNNREATCYYQTSNQRKTDENLDAKIRSRRCCTQDDTSGSSLSTFKAKSKNPRLVLSKERSRRKYQAKEGPHLEHYILLPTLVVRTPSNVKRQKKFNELYHRILNEHLNSSQTPPTAPETQDQKSKTNIKKDIGFNINITLSDTSREMNGKF